MIAPAPRHARDGLFDNLDRIMALGAGRWALAAGGLFPVDRFGRPFQRSHSTAGWFPTNAV